MSRTRGFDLDQALASALDVFRARGFEGASLTALTAAMGITRPSLYAAFGNKEELFRRALERYEQTTMAFLRAALAAPSARDAVGRLLHGFADALTACGQPPGCLATTGALASSDTCDPIRRALIAKREAYENGLRERLLRAEGEGDLPRDADPGGLARYVMTIAHGMSIQAASGADRATLHAIVDTALRFWPAHAAPAHA